MNDRAMLKRKIHEIDFGLYELLLFLDSHPTNQKAMQLTDEYREHRRMLIDEYEKCYGKYVVTPSDVPTGKSWQWLDGPWPWDNDFMEA